MSERSPRVVLLQARRAGDPILTHELECFAARVGLGVEAFRAVNMAADPFDATTLEGADLVMVGGAGDFSVVLGGFAWHEALLEMMRIIVRSGTPMFASCFGFQALVQALGGRLERDKSRSELGTHTLHLTEAGEADPTFGRMPHRFDAQFGHNDSAITLPEGLVNLASTDRCPLQAVRHVSAPVVATQFHPELSDRDNITRYLRYIEEYKKPGESMDEAREAAEAMHRPCPDALRLLPLFMEELGLRHG